MASVWCFTAAPAIFSPSPSPAIKTHKGAVSVSPNTVRVSVRSGRGRRGLTVCMVVKGDGEEEEDGEQQRRRHPLDFPYEFERPKAAGRTNVFPKLPPMTTPLPTWLPYDQEPDDEIDEDELDFEEEQEYEENPEQFE